MGKVAAVGDPTKDFFVFMITKDITLEDCIFDLIDNAVDGARKALAAGREQPEGEGMFRGFCVTITANAVEFVIRDNGSGISIAEAERVAFRFGREMSAKPETAHGIGLYGIGMKRAMFKIGRLIEVKSSTTTESFASVIDVNAWLTKKDEWAFELESASATEPGTSIKITQLTDEVARDLRDPVFISRLRKVISRDYSLILQDGFSIIVNNEPVHPFIFTLLSGGEFRPVSRSYSDDGVGVTIYSGFAHTPAADLDPDEYSRTPDEYWGWFVACNERVVLAADKTERTVWGVDGFAKWHPQFNGFMGIVHFDSDDPRKLPWTTTKRGVDLLAPVYRRAVGEMQKATNDFIRYTNTRKAFVEEAKSKESQARPLPLTALSPSETLVTPKFERETPRIRVSTISYQRPTAIVEKAKAALGRPSMSNRDMGGATFDYYVKQELGR
jgi:hypothetical protein